MALRRAFTAISFVMALLAISGWNAPAQDVAGSASTATLGDALKMSLEPQARIDRYDAYIPPGAKGVYQRSFFDFQDAKAAIRIAFVIDSTNTMDADIESLRTNLREFVKGMTRQVTDVRSSADVDVEVAIVTYRDLLKSSVPLVKRPVPVEVLTDEGPGFLLFHGEYDEIDRLFGSIQLESGDPGFPEQVDRGLYTALTELDWGTETDVTRVIFVAGDAPPWDERYLDRRNDPAWWRSQDRPLRGHSTDDLIALANQKGVKIYSVACNSGVRPESRETVLRDYYPSLVRFFEEISQRTGGAFLNLWNASTVQSLHELADESRGDAPVLLELKQIPREDLQHRRSSAEVSVAVLPPISLKDMTFSGYDNPANDFANDLVYRLQRIDGRSICTMADTRDGWSKFTAHGQRSEAELSELVKTLEVDFLIWGDYQAAGDGQTATTTLRAYNLMGQEVEAASATGPVWEVAGLALTNLVKAMSEAGASGSSQAAKFARFYGHQELHERIQVELADSAAAYDALMTGWDYLERSTEFDRTESKNDGRGLLLDAKEHLAHAVQVEPNNPFALLLLSSCHYNLGEQDAALARLKQAYASRNETEDRLVTLEIEADYALFVEHDPLRAIETYQSIVQATRIGRPKTALRALWMLAGLYLGDWGAGEHLQKEFKSETERLDLARGCILDIVAYWPESAEARYYLQFIEPELKLETDRSSESRLRLVHDVYRLAVPAAGRSRIVRSVDERAIPGS